MLMTTDRQRDWTTERVFGPIWDQEDNEVSTSWTYSIHENALWQQYLQDALERARRLPEWDLQV